MTRKVGSWKFEARSSKGVAGNAKRSHLSLRASHFPLPASLVVLAAAADTVLGQGCAMCKTSIAGQADAVIASLGLGVAILLFPPMVIVAAILYAAFRRG